MKQAGRSSRTMKQLSKRLLIASLNNVGLSVAFTAAEVVKIM